MGVFFLVVYQVDYYLRFFLFGYVEGFGKADCYSLPMICGTI